MYMLIISVKNNHCHILVASHIQASHLVLTKSPLWSDPFSCPARVLQEPKHAHTEERVKPCKIASS